jgi:hypothetical protein
MTRTGMVSETVGPEFAVDGLGQSLVSRVRHEGREDIRSRHIGEDG